MPSLTERVATLAETNSTVLSAQPVRFQSPCMWAFEHSNLGDRWIPVPFPPPVLPRLTVSVQFCRAEIANNQGFRAQNSALRRPALYPSLGPFVSKPPHFANLVRFS